MSEQTYNISELREMVGPKQAVVIKNPYYLMLRKEFDDFFKKIPQQHRFVDSKTAELGIRNIMFEGVPVCVLEDMLAFVFNELKNKEG